MPKFVTIGYGGEAGYQRLGKAPRNSVCQASSNLAFVEGAFLPQHSSLHEDTQLPS